jgi:hypothetical protein
VSEYDAAFGPMGAAPDGTSPPLTSAGGPNGNVRTLQNGLNELGFGPIATTGLVDAPTLTALTKFYADKGVANWTPDTSGASDQQILNDVIRAVLNARKSRGSVTGAAQVAASNAAKAAGVLNDDGTVVPFWKNPKVLIGAAVVGVVAYFWMRSSNGESLASAPAGAAPVAGVPDDLPALAPTKSRKTWRDAPRKEKCNLTPDVDFDSGAALETP